MTPFFTALGAVIVTDDPFVAESVAPETVVVHVAEITVESVFV